MNNPNVFAMRKQMLEDRIKNIASLLDISEDQAFMRLIYALLFDTAYDDPDYDLDVVDGGGDKQIDIVRIDESPDQAVIHLIQVKNSESYKGTVVVQLRDGLDWIFKWPEEKYKQLANKDLVMKISSIRELSGQLGLRKLDVVVHYVAKGDTSRISPGFSEEIEHTTQVYHNSGEFRSFELKVWGAKELVDRIYELEQISKQVNEDLPIYLTPYAPAYSQYRTDSIKAVICTVDGIEIAKLVNKHKHHLFEENVRIYLGSKRRINSEILETCSNPEEAQYFWFFNNGITVTCDDFDVAYNVNPPRIKITNMQIVNGCQTSMSLAEAYNSGDLISDTRVLFKVYAIKDQRFVDRITLTTNSQNAVSSRDLRSNDVLQRDLEKLFKARGYYYERKPRMFINLPKHEKKKVISNEKLGQAHLAVVEHLPSISMSRKSSVWGEYYNDVFGSRVSELLSAYLIYNYCFNIRKMDLKSNSQTSGLEEAVVKYGTFHLSRIVCSYQLGEYWKKHSEDYLSDFIKDVENTPERLREDYERAKILLVQIITDLAKGDISRTVNIFKSGDIQKQIDSELSKPQPGPEAISW